MASQTSSTRRGILAGALVLNLGFVLWANLFAFEYAPLQDLARATGGWASQTLVVNLIGLGLIVGVWLAIVGRTQLRSIGLEPSRLTTAVYVVGGTWIAVQVLAAIGAVASGHSLADFSPEFMSALPILAGQLLGNAAYEEIFYRGYLIRALAPEVGGRIWMAVLLSAALFGLIHIPNYLVRGLSMMTLMPAALAGVIFGFVYVRTGNIWLCIGLHSLLNAPAPLWDSPVPAQIAPAVVLLAYLVIPANDGRRNQALSDPRI